MKKIFTVFYLLFNFIAFADVQTPAYQTWQDAQKSAYAYDFNNIESVVLNSLSGIKLNNGEYIKITGKIDKNSKLCDLKIEQMKMNSEKANLITEKLAVAQIKTNGGYDEFELYLYAKADYSNDKTPVIIFDLLNKDMTVSIENNKEKIKKLKDDIYYGKLYANCLLKDKSPKNAGINILIDKNGNLLRSKIIKSSGNKEYDEKILKTLKSSYPFQKFNIENVDFLSITYDSSKNYTYQNKIKNNFNLSASADNSSFSATARILLNNKGDVINKEIIKSSKNEQIDEQLLLAVEKTKNFFELLKPDDKPPFVKYITFDKRAGSKLLISHFSLGDDINKNQKEIRSYINKVEFLTKRNWRPVEDKAIRTNRSIVVLFVLDKNGKVTASTITFSSGSSELDETVLNAVNSAVLPHIPDDFGVNYLPFEMIFNYIAIPEVNPILKEIYYPKNKKK